MTSMDYRKNAAAMVVSRPPTDYPRAPTLRWANLALITVVWVSAAIFGSYIVAFYARAVSEGAPERWNESLPYLYEPNSLLATTGIAVHFIAGAILLMLGPIQLFSPLRVRWPAVHRWIGRLYGLTALLAGLGGLTFILFKGTIGGAVMNVGFGLYGALMVVASVATVHHARQRRFERHRAWAIRLFALAIGSWLYRMDYGFWRLIAHNAGHTHSFDGPFDIAMVFLFYVPNLFVAEAFIRARRRQAHPGFQMMVALCLVGVAACLAFSTYIFTKLHWGPPILHWLFGTV
jgi:hypothetical protein